MQVAPDGAAFLSFIQKNINSKIFKNKILFHKYIDILFRENYNENTTSYYAHTVKDKEKEENV